MAKTIPILFSTQMIREILTRNKTISRRIVKPQPDYHGLWNDTDHPRSINSSLEGWNGTVEETGESKEFVCRYGQPGDILWVREKFAIENDHFIYAADEGISMPFFNANQKWKPSIFMPKESCRLFLRVKSVRVERLNDITEQDARAEGFGCIGGFKELWGTINGNESWNKNPWVWVIKFEKTNMPENFFFI